jgi:hypothetical protein
LTSGYFTYARGTKLPRIPLKAYIDITHRCNNRCRHCWLWMPDEPEERAAELTTEEWRAVVDQARALGTRDWAISGGEPMLREDFTEIFEYVTAKSTRYSLNTNGTLITPKIAQLLQRKGNKMVAVYGATAEVYDHVTRNPGGFEALLQGLAYLKEAGVGFTMQLIPMRDNWHQWEDMLAFAQSWSTHWRVGAPWLFKTACGDPVRNAEIERQRLDPADVVMLDPPDVTHESRAAERAARAVGSSEPDTAEECRAAGPRSTPEGTCLYATCIETRRDFHVDPYGGMTFCCFVKDPALRYDLRSGPGAVAFAWETFIPSVADITLGPGRPEDCSACDLRSDCRWCGVYGYLEERRHDVKVDYLCAVARETREFKTDWQANHRRFFEIAGVTIQVESDLPFGEKTLHRKFECFRVPGPGHDTVTLRHRFWLPDLRDLALGEEVHRKPPWVVYRSGTSWIYAGVSAPPEAESPEDSTVHQVACFSSSHDFGDIYHDPAHGREWREGNLEALTLFASDQLLIARLLADRQACLLHSGGLTLDGKGLLFVGHSEAGKSTTMMLLRKELGSRVEILCDDRNVVRHWPEGLNGEPPGFYLHGTWSHGDVPDVSGASAPLRAVLFLKQDLHNTLVPLTDRNTAWRLLLATVIRPLVTADWWEKELDVLERLIAQVPCYTMHFDKSGAIAAELEGLVR